MTIEDVMILAAFAGSELGARPSRVMKTVLPEVEIAYDLETNKPKRERIKVDLPIYRYKNKNMNGSKHAELIGYVGYGPSSLSLIYREP